MKICPRCEAELKDSVIRCVRCGQPMRGDEPEAPPAVMPASGIGVPAGPRPEPPTASSVWGGVAPPVSPAPVSPAPTPVPAVAVAAPAPPRSGWAPPTAGRAPLADLTPRRALPVRRSWGPDPLMLIAGLAAAAAGALAYLAIKEPWVHLTVTRAATDTDPALVATLSLRGKAAFAGTAGMAIAGALGVLGLVWLLYGFQRGWTMPSVVNPAFGILVSVAGLLATGLASMVWFVWKDAMVLRAKAADMSMQAMQRLLDQQPAPLVQIQRLAGLMSFGGMMVLGLVASCLGWYAYRRRE